MVITEKLKAYLLAKAIEKAALDPNDSRITSLTPDSVSVIEPSGYANNSEGEVYQIMDCRFIAIIDTLGMMSIPFRTNEFVQFDYVNN